MGVSPYISAQTFWALRYPRLKITDCLGIVSLRYFLNYFRSSIHSHSDSHCFMKVLDGSLKETLYNWPSRSEKKSEMQHGAESTYNRDQVTYINGESVKCFKSCLSQHNFMSSL